MKKFLFLSILCLALILQGFSQISMLDARIGRSGSTVTIKGLVLNNAASTGNVWYLQDATGGMAVYDAKLAAAGVKRGDMITVTGLLSNYSALMEMKTVTSVIIESSNNTLPQPSVLTPDQLTGDDAELLESTIVCIKNATFAVADRGGIFGYGSTGKNYVLTANGKTFELRILPTSILVGKVIPSSSVTVYGCLAQYLSGGTDDTRTGYQLITRDVADLVSNLKINFTSNIGLQNITKTGFDLTWTTDVAGSTEAFYGKTPALELGKIGGTGGSSTHTLSIAGNAADIFYVKAFSVLDLDTCKSATQAYATISNSTGKMDIFFNSPVNTTVSTGVDAVYLNHTAEAKIIEYINKAKSTLDIAIYNFNNTGLTNNLSTAINAAADRNVVVRVLYCGTSANIGTDELNSKVNKLKGPIATARLGIMHNKFMVIDANATDANDPLVMSGSMNWTVGNMYDDPNNLVFVQDQTLAKVYTIEFEEMWGSKTTTPDLVKGKWGMNKTNNTPHELIIGGKRVESYFSPSDGVNSRIVSLIKTAESDIEVATMLVTRTEIAYAISDAARAGAKVSFIVDNLSGLVMKFADGTNDYRVPNAIGNAAQQNFIDYKAGATMHNKYMIVDQSNPTSDPLVLTGSHNWSSSADVNNDENTLVIHDATIANLYHQNIVELLKNGTVILDVPVITVQDNQALIFPNPSNGALNISFNASKPGKADVSVYDLSGRRVYANFYSLNDGQNTMNLNLNVNRGIYLLRIAVGQKVFNQKITVN